MKYIISLISISLLISCGFSNYNSDDYSKCKIIAEKLKKRDLSNDTLLEFYLEDLDVQKVISEVILNEQFERVIATSGKVIHRGMGRGHIYVYKSNSEISIFIETQDRGHGGEYGYGYFSGSNKLTWDSDNWGEFWSIKSKVESHWWEIQFDLG